MVLQALQFKQERSAAVEAEVLTQSTIPPPITAAALDLESTADSPVKVFVAPGICIVNWHALACHMQTGLGQKKVDQSQKFITAAINI